MKRATWNQARLEALIVGNLDAAKVSDAVANGIRRLNLDVTFTKEEASDVLDAMCNEPGTIGIAARFAKVRLVLMPDD
ncbi:MAG TPA: hypothetical protein VM686_32765 [Polyangiaceae bacterium]|jgi:hypothetical protein|nr:hypothetical protein [Polyangiaceae bacterium]